MAACDDERMSRNSWIALAILAVITSVFGIWTALNQSGAVAEHIQGEWTLIEASDATGGIDASVTPVVLTIDGSTLGGTVCNHFGGDYTVSGSTFTVGALATTEMWCETPTGIMDVETRFVQALSVVNTARYEGTNLVLTGVDIRLVFSSPTPD
ncbi:MAG: hypothetical protein RJA31_812 [Actinomycetota bacterium]